MRKSDNFSNPAYVAGGYGGSSVTREEVIAELKEFLKSIEQFPDDDTFRFELDRASVQAILSALTCEQPNEVVELCQLTKSCSSKR